MQNAELLGSEMLNADGTLKQDLKLETPTLLSIREAWKRISDVDHMASRDEPNEIREYLTSALFRAGLIAHAMQRAAAESEVGKKVIGDLADESKGVWAVLQQISMFLLARYSETHQQD